MTPETVQHSRSTPLSPQGARRGLTDETAAQSQVLNGKNIFRIGHSGGVLVDDHRHEDSYSLTW